MTPAILVEMVKRHAEFDLVYSPDYRGVGIAAILTAHLLGKPAVMCTAALGVINGANLDGALTRAGIAPAGLLGRLVKWPFRTIYTSAAAYPAITRAIADEAVAAGVPAARVHYLPNSVDTTRFAPVPTERRATLRAELGMAPDAVVCLFLARLSREKGLMDLLEAWRLLPAGRSRLVVVGPDMTGHPMDVGPEARAFVASHGLGDRVTFAGPTLTAERWLQAADVLIQPSHWEGAPFGIIEAMACGVAIVATRVGGMAEVLVDGETALLCPPQSPQGLADAITRATGDAALRALLGAAARRAALAEFDARVICQRHLELFRAVTASRSK